MTIADSAPHPGTLDFPLGCHTVLNALQLDPVDVDVDADVRSLAHAMAEHSVHCVVVRGMGPGGWGIVSDLDLMAAMRPELADTTAAELASDPLIIEPADTLQRAAQLMAEHEASHAVVVDPVTGEPVGILSTLDVARWAAA